MSREEWISSHLLSSPALGQLWIRISWSSGKDSYTYRGSSLTCNISSFVVYHCLCDWQSPSLIPSPASGFATCQSESQADFLLPGQNCHGCLWQRCPLFTAFLLKLWLSSLLSLVIYMDLLHAPQMLRACLREWGPKTQKAFSLHFTSIADSKYMNSLSFGWCQTEDVHRSTSKV